ncbi:MAG: hypothetical protein U9Q89_05340 [Thermodesulfobacteriota bacterium]|nr:hypothetical protein [Thermodesulfobacteriota bacterium]
MADNFLYIDLESVCSQQPGIKEQILSELKPPGNLKKAETIAKWWQSQAPSVAEEAYLKTALDGTYGEIISIAWAFGEQEVQGVIRTLEEPETKVLKAFYDALEGANTDYLVWVAYPIRFDLPFLLKRSIINNIRPPVGLPDERSKSTFCPMNWWHGWHQCGALDALCKALGIQGKTGMTGADVYPYVLQGRYDEILEYNKNDVSMLRQVHERITFKNWAPSDNEEIALASEEDEKLTKAGFFDVQEKGKL